MPPTLQAKVWALPAAKRVRYLNFSERFSAKRAPYGNCELYGLSGTLLAKCDARKARWYVGKGLAVVEAEDPLRIRLTFEPESRLRFLFSPFRNESSIFGSKHRRGNAS